jgi:hypothetical protein
LSAAKLSASVGGANISVDDTTSLYKNGGCFSDEHRVLNPSNVALEAFP